MIEITVLFALVIFIAAYVFWPQEVFTSLFAKDKTLADQRALILETDISRDSVSGNQFLAHLQHEIEVTLFPRPTDSVLKRHYDNLVAAKLEERLTQMPM